MAAAAYVEHLSWGLWGHKGKTLPHGENRWAGLSFLVGIRHVPSLQRRSSGHPLYYWKLLWLCHWDPKALIASMRNEIISLIYIQ